MFTCSLLMWLLVPSVVIEAPDAQWTLATEDTEITLAISGDTLLITRLASKGEPHSWIAQPAPVPLMARVGMGGQERSTSWKYAGVNSTPEAGTVVFTFKNEDPALVLRSIWWAARAGCGPIEHRLEISNASSSPVTLFHQDSLTLAALAPGGTANVYWIRRGGGNASTQGGTSVEPLTPALNLNLVSNCDDGASPSPWMAVQVGAPDGAPGGAQRGLYVGWEFSGLGRVEAQGAGAGDATGLAMALGNLPDFKTDIAPGEVFLVPPAFVGCYAGDIDDGAYALHQWMLRHKRPALPEDIADPTLAYNLYLDAGGPNAREADVMRSAAFCRDIGFETFMPDAMWFPACGDWRWDPARFPNGIHPIGEFVHGSGMKLALWCAWTNGGVSEHPDALSVRGPAGHPEWFEGDYPADWHPGPFYGGRICLACPEARAWAIHTTQWLVSNHNLDYLKHDCGPIVTRCNKSTHRHSYGVDASYWATMGYYEVQERLRQAFPRVILENCSGGGHIKDFGIMARTHYTVTTDTLSNLPDRQSIYDSTFAFPPLILQAYTYEREYKVPGDDPGPFLWRSAMMGAWQIDPTNTRIWNEEDRDCARRHAEIYKTWIRPMLKDVKVHHILPRPDGKRWDGMFYWSPSLKRGTLYIFRPDAEESQRIIALKGLAPEQEYWIWSEDGGVPAGARRGADLMQAGLAVDLPARYTSDLVYFQEASLGKPAGLDAPGAFTLGRVETRGDFFTTCAQLSWAVSAAARSYHLVIADGADFSHIVCERQCTQPSMFATGLPADRVLWWKVEAVAYGGKRWNEGGPAQFTTAKLDPLTGVTFVSDMPWAKATAGAGNSVHRDTNYSEATIGIAGQAYPKGIWSHAFKDSTPADLVLDISGKSFVAFAADAGVEDSAGQGTVAFQVLVDGAIKAESPVMQGGQVHRFAVDVTGAREVTLRVLNGGDGFNCDHAAWGLARFIEKGAADPFAEKK